MFHLSLLILLNDLYILLWYEQNEHLCHKIKKASIRKGRGSRGTTLISYESSLRNIKFI